MVDELLTSILQRYVSPQDYDLHDWDTIIERRTLVKDGVYSYPCVYANILLTEALEFYDAEPKQPIHGDIIMNNLSEDDQLIISVLEKYVPWRYRGDVDWVNVLARKETVKPNVYKYKLNNIEFYLDDCLNPVEYGNVHIIDGVIYYDSNANPEKEYAPKLRFGEL